MDCWILIAPLGPLVAAPEQVEPWPFADRITPRHLLSHSAGVANRTPVRGIHPAGRPGPDQAAFPEGLLARHRKLRFAPGTRSSYSNLGTLVLSQAMSSAAGRPYADLVRDEILQLPMHGGGHD